MPPVIAKPAFRALQKLFAKGIDVLRSEHSGTRRCQACALAVVLTATTLILHLALMDPLAGQPTLIIFTVPIMLSAYLGGMRAGLLATALSLLAASYFFFPPLESFAVASASARWKLFFVAMAGFVISTLNELLHRARRHADALMRQYQQAEAVAREERELLAALVENVTDGIVSCDAEGVITLFNRATRELHGVPGEAIPAERWAEHFDLYLPDGATRMPKEQIALFRALNEGAVHDAEMVIAPKGGTPRRVSSRGQAFYDAAGRKTGAVVAMQDITERRRAERALEDIKVRLAHAMSLAQLVAWEYDPVNDLLTFDDRYYELFSTTAEAEGGYQMSAGEFVRRFMHPDDASVVAEEFGKAMTTADRDYRAQTECRIYRRDGELRHFQVSISVSKNAEGETIGIHGANQDITDRKRAEVALRTSEQRLAKALHVNQQVLDKSLDMVCTIDAAGLFTSVSAACERLLGYTPAEMIGRPSLDFILEGDRASTTVAAAQLPTGRELHDFENRYVRKDGSALTISWSASWSEEDQSIFCVGRDCTVRKLAEEAHAGRLIAERANLAKSEFLSRMSHELRTPMNAILGFAQVLETEDGLAAEHLDSVQHILKGGAHLLKLINEVLDITSIESGNMTISPEVIALPGLVGETVSLLRPLSAEFGVRLSVLPGVDAPRHVRADRQRLKQVLLNLVGNAIKYNRPNGTVTVRYHAASGAGARTRISVTDTGAGLDAAKLCGLFQPFERLGAEQTQIEGTGLGLVLAKRMIEHMHGTLGVESVLGEGSTFWIELPTAEPPAEMEKAFVETAADVAPEVPAERRVVLSIEDNPSNTRLITRILARRPAIHLLNAETGAGGLRMAREFRPDLILLDLHLPDSDGDCVLERLAADPRTAAIPVVVITADAVRGKAEKLRAAGASDFLTKPVDVRAFLAVVDRILLPAGAGVGA